MTLATSPRFLVKVCDRAVVAKFVDQRILDDVVIRAVGEHLTDLVERQGHVRLVLNLRNVEFLATEMLARIIQIKRGMLRRGEGDIKLCCVEPHLLKCIKDLSMHKLVEVHEDEASALKSFERSR
jgi:stage II sporulation protein AA (anti-sigma F factor antagonist)